MFDYYEKYAKQYADETLHADMSEQYGAFLPLLEGNAKILDLGSGRGRDASYFQKQGYQVTALEPSHNLCKEIRKVFSGRVICSDIQSFHPDECYDGIWACASLLHLHEDELLHFFENLETVLKGNGVIYFSGKNGIETGTAKDDRYYLEFTEALIEKIIAVNDRLKIKQLQYSEDVGGRKGFRWMNIIFRME